MDQSRLYDVGDLCTDASSLFYLDYPGVRRISIAEGMVEQDKFLVEFMGFARIPDS